MIKIWQFFLNCLNMAAFEPFSRKKTCVQVVVPSFWLPSGEILPQKKKKQKTFIARQKKGYFIYIVN